MKQNFYSLLLTALLGMTGLNAWADDYEIATAQDLVDFAAVVNGGDFTANAVLTDDIDMSSLTTWIPIGDWGTQSGTTEACYKGHFDGQGHTITGFNFTANQNYFGIFGVISTGALIENFTIYGTVSCGFKTMGVVGYARDATPTIRNIHSYLNINNTAAGNRHGGILGSSVNGTIVVDRCTYSGTLDGKDSGGSGNYGGIVGYVNNNANAHLRVTNCLFDGKLVNSAATPGGCTFGGMVGYVGASPDVTLTNCLSVGTVQSAVTGQFYGAVKHNTCSIINSFYQGDNINGTTSGVVTPTTQEVTKVTDQQLASGEIAFLLNENVSGGTNWFQQIKNMAFAAEQYVVSTNGTPRDPQTANVTLVGEADGTYTFTLPNFVLHTNMADLPVGDLRLEGITIYDDGTFSEDNTFSVPDENIPSLLGTYSDKLKNVAYTLDGKVNGDRLYATIEDININLGAPFPAYQIFIEVGTDDFIAQAPKGDATPTPYGTSLVYANGSFNCDMTPKAGSDVIYSNVNAAFVDDHTFASGFCTVCGAINESWLTPNADGNIELGTLAQLKWFAAYVNQVNASANAILTGDIDMGGIEWTPIGNSSVAFTGKFDGQGKTITGFSQTATTTHNGLFGNINGATVQNFSISGSLTSDKNYCGVIGLSKGSSKVKGIHSSLNLDIQFKGWAGGVVGGADGFIVIEECTFDGTLDTHNFDDSKGGILGYANGATIKNCLFSGTIVGEAKQHYGGILGYVNNGSFGGVQNCLSIGSVTTTNTSHNGVAAIIGNMNTSTKVDGIFNNYWLTGSSYAGNNGAKAPDAEAPFEVTAEQLASGEVAYKLGSAWSQLLGTDAVPTLYSNTPVSYVGNAGYATLYDTTTGYNLNGDVKAYAAVLNNTWLELSEIPSIPESTPVVLKGGYYNKLAADLPAINVANDLKGTDADTAADGSMYILANGADGIGFYQATGTIPAGKAYFQSTSGVKTFFFEGDDATGINEVNGQWSMVNGQSIYSLAGQRIQKMQKGINIVGKKKVLY